MLIHPRPEIPQHAQRPASSGTETHMFERDDLFLRERLAELRETAATLHSAGAVTHGGVLDRTRRTIGRGLIAVGSVIAGASDDLRDATDARDAGLVA
jgi:hypothetical protein